MVGRDVTVEGAVERVVPLGPGALRLLAYLQATDLVVGVEQHETRPERSTRPYNAAIDVGSRPSVGSRKDPDRERLLELAPDAIVWAYASEKKADSLQRKLGIPVVAIDPGDLVDTHRDRFYTAVSLLGDMLGREQRAAEVRSYVADTLDELGSKTPVPNSETPRSYIGYLGRGKHGFTYTMPTYPGFSFIDTRNVASGVSEGLKKKKGAARVAVDAETVIEWDPEYVFVDRGGESYDALSNPEFSGIDAIENDRVYGVLPIRDYAANPGTELANAFAVGAVLFPDSFDADPETKANDVYEALLGERVYDVVAEGYGGGYGKIQVE